MTITNGTVEFERNLRPAEFESKRAKSVLFFVVEPGDDIDAIHQGAMLKARTTVLAALGLPAAPLAGVTEASLQRESAGAASQGTATRGRPRTQPVTTNTALVPPAGSDPFGDGVGTATAVVLPATPPMVVTAVVGTGETAPTAVSHSDAELTDTGLRTALEAKVGAAADTEREALTVRIRALIAGIHKDPVKSVYMMSKEQRSMFLTQLSALK